MKINFRAFLFVFCCAATVILCSLVAFYARPLGIALLVSEGAGITALGIRAGLRRDFFKLAACAVALGVAVYLTCAFFVALAAPNELADGGRYTVTGRVTEQYRYDADYNIWYATLDELKADGREVGGKLRLSIFDPVDECFDIACGTRIAVAADVRRTPLIDAEGLHAELVRTGQRYEASCNGADIFAFAEGLPRPLESARIAVKERLLAYMDEDAARVAFSMIAGDKYLLDNEVKAAYSTAGIGHILAVSGLHIGLLAGLLTALLYRLPLPRNVSRVLLTLLLLLYLLFTGGSPSATRAFVMCCVGIWAPLFGKRDDLNCLCLAATVCLCISPFFFFESGWVMSCSSVFGLVLFARPLQNFLTRLHMPQKIAAAIAPTLAVQTGALPAIAFFFHRFYFWSFIVNAVGLAALAAFFTAMAICLPFAMLPPLGFLLTPFGLIIGALNEFCFFVTTLPLAAAVWQVSAAVFLILILAFGLSRFVIMPHKRPFNIVLLGLCAVVAVAAENSIKSDDALLAVGGNLAVTVVYDGDTRYLLSGFAHNVVRQVDESRVGGGAYVVYGSSLDATAAENILGFADARPVKEVCVPYTSDRTGERLLRDAGIQIRFVADGDGDFFAAYDDGAFCGWLYNSRGKTAYITDGAPDYDASAAADVVRCAGTDETSYPFARYLTAPYKGSPVLYDFRTNKAKQL